MAPESASSGTLPYSPTLWWRRPQSQNRPSFYWHVASRSFALALRAVPRRYRFSAVKTTAHLLTPLVERTFWYRAQRELRIDRAKEIALHYALTIMTHSGVPFDPEINVDGAERFEAAWRKGRGVLVVAPHALLSLLLFRYLYDIGCTPTIISAAPYTHVYGKRLVIPSLQPSPATMFCLRSALRRGGVACAMIDQLHSEARRAIEVRTPEGPIYISDALFRLAERCGSNVIFTAARLEKGRGLVLTFAAPESRPSVETLTKDFIAFLQAHLASDAS